VYVTDSIAATAQSESAAYAVRRREGDEREALDREHEVMPAGLEAEMTDSPRQGARRAEKLGRKGEHSTPRYLQEKQSAHGRAAEAPGNSIRHRRRAPVGKRNACADPMVMSVMSIRV
jgi:hypothetical protein